MLRWHLGEVLHDAYPARDDLGRLSAWLEAQGRRELPKSTLVRVVSPVANYGHQVELMDNDLRECATGKPVRRMPRW